MDERFQTFTVLITRLSRSIKRIKGDEMAEFGLKGPHVSCLYYLLWEDGCTAARLCECCEEDKAAISRSLDYLEERGYLTCEVHGQRRYKSPLHLTPEGRQVAQAVAGKISRIVREASADLSEGEREIMYRGLTAICEKLEHISEQQGV